MRLLASSLLWSRLVLLRPLNFLFPMLPIIIIFHRSFQFDIIHPGLLCLCGSRHFLHLHDLVSFITSYGFHAQLLALALKSKQGTVIPVIALPFDGAGVNKVATQG